MWWGKFYEGLEEDWTYRPYMLNSGAEKARGSSGKRLESGFTARGCSDSDHYLGEETGTQSWETPRG